MAERHKHLRLKKRSGHGTKETASALRNIADIIEESGVMPSFIESWNPPRSHKEHGNTWEVSLTLWGEVNADEVEDPTEGWAVSHE